MNKSIYYKTLSFISIVLSIIMLLSLYSCGEADGDDVILFEGPADRYVISEMYSYNVVRVEFTGVKTSRNEKQFIFLVKDVINIRSEKNHVEIGDTVSFVYSTKSIIEPNDETSIYQENGYDYEIGKEYVIMYVMNSWDRRCYIPLANLNCMPEINQKEFWMYTGLLVKNLTAEDFIAELKVMVALQKECMYGSGGWPFPHPDFEGYPG